jgi:putative addiction module killer protein
MFVLKKTDYFEHWLTGLRDVRARAKILARLKRAELGNLGVHKSVGDRVFEMIIDYGPGYRVYFSRSQGVLILLLFGGDKSSQVKDIKRAKQICIEIGA